VDNEIAQAVDTAIKYCQENNIMAEYLKKHETEVHSMLMRELSIRYIFDSKYNEGLEVGYKNIAKKMIKANKSDHEIHEMTELSFNIIRKLRELYT